MRRLAATCLALAAASTLAPARALPPPPGPTAAATTTPSPAPSEGSYLPAGSPIDFVLDGKVDSHKTQPGTVVGVHLQKALVVGGVTLAPAGTPGTLKIVAVEKAEAPDIDGSVHVELAPLQLPGRGSLPVAAMHDYITLERTAGQQSTSDLADTAIEIFVPYYALARAFRKGRELTLPPGSILRARTEASIDASQAPKVVISTPPPFEMSTDQPHSAYTPPPFYTAPGVPQKPATPKPNSTAAPGPTPT